MKHGILRKEPNTPWIFDNEFTQLITEACC